MFSTLEKGSPQATIQPDAGIASSDTGAPLKKKLSQRTDSFRILAYLLFSLGWLAPILCLAVLNFRSYVVGTTLSCGVTHCRADPWAVEAAGSQKFESRDHEILSALQLVAKALEIWFVFLAGVVVFDFTILLAGRGDGLPLRHLTIPFDYTELKSFLEPSLWTSIIPLNETRPRPRNDVTGDLRATTSRRNLYIFVFLVFAMCIVCNLMGPVTAVLLIPSLSWREVGVPEKYRVFTNMASTDPPMNQAFIDSSECTSSSLSTGNYSCVPSQIDTILLQTNGVIPSLNSEELVSFIFNFTWNPIFDFWDILAPNRQVLDSISYDYYGWSSIYNPDYNPPVDQANFSVSTFQALSNAREVIVYRQGPSLLLSGNCFASVSTSVIQISSNKGVVCYDLSGYDIAQLFPVAGPYNGVNVSTMCMPTGTGWIGNNAHSKFQVANYSSPDPIVVNVYSADKAIYLNPATYHCSTAKNATGSASCDWDSMFAANPEGTMRNISINPLVAEYSSSDNSSFWICLSFSFLRLSTYILDTSGNSPFSLGLVELEGEDIINHVDEPLFIHPDWVLASMAVDLGGTVPEYRSSSAALTDALQYTDDDYTEDLTWFHAIIMAQALTLIDYATEDVNSTSDNLPTSTPLLSVRLLLYAWMYGLQSITSKLGAAVAIIGCVIVLIGIVVKTWGRTVPRDMLDIVTAALKQTPPEVLKSLEEKETVKVRFRMKNGKDREFEF
ncbi:hypothetical protein N431DRAFT_448644 [Stipitochalara longipes BDJ]|nr:hypothetical protein N431DRAFT_448644 [Stipitochalara longipes BDJ]